MSDWEELIFDALPSGTSVSEPVGNLLPNREPLVVSGDSQGFAGRNQINRISTSATTGSFTINPNGLGSISIAGNATASTIQTALEANASINPGDVNVTGGPLGSDTTPVFVEWTGQFALEHVVVVLNNSGGAVGLRNTWHQTYAPASPLVLEAFDAVPPGERAEWISSADSQYAVLARAPLHDSREITLKVRVNQQATKDEALDALAVLTDRLAAARNDREGIPLQWTPAGATYTVIGDVLLGSITDGIGANGSDDVGLWWLQGTPVVGVKLTLKPYWRAATETISSATTASTPIVSMEVTAGGDVPALARLIITEAASQARRDVEWGLEGPGTYNSATSLLLDSDSLTTAGFGGVGATRAGAYDPNATGNNVIRHASVTSLPTVICGTGAQSHIGTYRVWARCYMANTGISVRLAWRMGDGSYSRNAWAPSPTGLAGQWVELDLGTITIPKATLGTQRWDARVEAMVTSSIATVDLDYLMLVPVTDGYGRARATFTYTPGLLTGYDDFETLTTGTVLGGRTAVQGGAWVTSGATTDFVGATVVNQTVARSTTVDSTERFAVLGSTNYTDSEVSAVTNVSGTPASGSVTRGVVARWVSASNYLSLFVTQLPTSTMLTLNALGGGGGTSVAIPPIGFARLRLIAYASGLAIGQMLNDSNGVLATLMLYNSTLATGGALATGKTGLIDRSGTGTVIARYYDEFTAGTPSGDPTVLFSGRSMQIRYDDVLRQESAGGYYGQFRPYRGTRFYLPPGPGRIAVATRRVDRGVAGVDNVTDSTTIQIGTTDRYLVAPRG